MPPYCSYCGKALIHTNTVHEFILRLHGRTEHDGQLCLNCLARQANQPPWKLKPDAEARELYGAPQAGFSSWCMPYYKTHQRNPDGAKCLHFERTQQPCKRQHAPWRTQDAILNFLILEKLRARGHTKSQIQQLLEDKLAIHKLAT
jgi:hypothetical protein